jgi:hypothetical protein
MNTTTPTATVTPGLPSFDLVWPDGTPAYGPYATSAIRDETRRLILSTGRVWPQTRITVTIPDVAAVSYKQIADAIVAAYTTN